MKRFLAIVLLAVSLLMLVSCSQQAAVSKEQEGDAYDFPVKPGTPEWKALGSNPEMLRACQIPADRLEKMSTKGLVETVLNYPLGLNFLAFNTPQQGINAVANGFNGLRELYLRKDAGRELLARYKELKPLYTDTEKGRHALDLSYIEIIMCQESILSNMTQDEALELMREVRKKGSEKQQSEAFGSMDKSYNYWLMGRIMQHKGYTPFVKRIQESHDLESFLRDGFCASAGVREDIEAYSEQFLKENGKSSR